MSAPHDAAPEKAPESADRDATRHDATPPVDPASTRYTDPPAADSVATRYSDTPAAAGAVVPGRLPRRFGAYELLEEIGHGGMGVVYKARQFAPERLVALKVIRSGQLATEEDVRLFRQEANEAARLDHPNIVPVYEVGEHDGLHFFTMKLVEGGSLNQRLDRYRNDYKAAARLTATAARAVHYAAPAAAAAPRPEAGQHPDRCGRSAARGGPWLGQAAGRGGRGVAVRGGGHAGVHGAGAGPRRHTIDHGGGRLRLGRRPVRAAGGPAAVPRGFHLVHYAEGAKRRAGASLEGAAGRAAGPGNNLPEVPVQAADPPLSLGGGAGRGPGSLAARRADPRTVGWAVGASLVVVPAQPGRGRPVGRGGRAARPRRGQRHRRRVSL